MAVYSNYTGDTSQTLDGLFKRVYGKFINLLPKGFKFQNDMAFEDALGDTFNENVLLAHEAGFTYAPSSEDAYNLNDAIAGQTRPASVNGSNISLRSRIGIQALHRAARSGEKAFKRALDVVVDNMKLSTHKRCEVDIIYGQAPLGVVASVDVAANTITLTQASFAPGHWAGMENSLISATATGQGVERGVSVTSAAAAFTIQGVNLDTRTITFSTDIITADAIVAGDELYYFGQLSTTSGGATWNSAMGVRQILSGPTTLFGVTTANYSLWNPSSYAVGGQLTFEKVNKAVYLPTSKGLDEDLCLYINPNTWADLLNDEVALRQHNEKKSPYKVGGDGIDFFSQNGAIKIKSSIYVKEGEGFLLPINYWRRVGSTDVTFEQPTSEGGTFIRLESVAAYELRIYSNQAPYSNRPGLGTVLTGIVNA